MNETQLDYFLYFNLGSEKYVKYYKGSYASDELKDSRLCIKNIDKPICFGFIFNTLERNQADKMGHWISLFIKVLPKSKRLDLKFLDSYKRPYESYGKGISNYINRLRILALNKNMEFKMENAPFILQGYGSKVCGAYSCFTLMNLAGCNQNSLGTIFAGFNRKNQKTNDSKMIRYMTDNWPKRTCSDMLRNPNGVSFCPVKTFDSPKCLPNCSCKHDCCKNIRAREYIRQRISKFLI